MKLLGLSRERVSNAYTESPRREQAYEIILKGTNPMGYTYRDGRLNARAILLDVTPSQVCDHIQHLNNNYATEIYENGRVIMMRDETNLGTTTSFVRLTQHGYQKHMLGPFIIRDTVVELNAPIDEYAAKSFFMLLASELYRDVESVSLDNWNVRTVRDLEFLSYIGDTVGGFMLTFYPQIAQKMKETRAQVHKDDADLQYVMALAGINDFEGYIYFWLNPNVVDANSVRHKIENIQGSLCAFNPHGFYSDHRVRRWALASTLGYHAFGRDFRYDPIRYRKKRQLSDLIFADYAKFSAESDWDPRNYDIDDLAERHRTPVALLSKVWSTSADQEERLRMIREVWRANLGNPEQAEAFIDRLTK